MKDNVAIILVFNDIVFTHTTHVYYLVSDTYIIYCISLMETLFKEWVQLSQ